MQNTNEIQKLKIGEYLCDRFDFSLNENSLTDPNNINTYIKCKTAKDIEGGYYDINFISKWGKALK